MIVHVSAHRESQSFAEYLDELLTGLGDSNSDAARRTGVSVSNISNWRRGATIPSIDRARQFADGMRISRLTVMMKAGLLEPADLDIDPLYLELAALDTLVRSADESALRKLRNHVGLLIEGTRRELRGLLGSRGSTDRKREAS